MFKRSFLALCRTLHVYLTMFGLLVMLMFGVTGFTLNHEDWFGATTPRVLELEGSTPAELLEKNDALRIVESVRSNFHVTGALDDYEDTPEQVTISFKQPGETWEVEIERSTGRTKVHAEAFNVAAVINNLHRGRDTGPAWHWIIDLSALLIVLACATGIVLWLALPRRRMLGVIALTLGIASTLGVFYLLVPGPGGPVRPRDPPAAKAPPDKGP